MCKTVNKYKFQKLTSLYMWQSDYTRPTITICIVKNVFKPSKPVFNDSLVEKFELDLSKLIGIRDKPTKILRNLLKF